MALTSFPALTHLQAFFAVSPDLPSLRKRTGNLAVGPPLITIAAIGAFEVGAPCAYADLPGVRARSLPPEVVDCRAGQLASVAAQHENRRRWRRRLPVLSSVDNSFNRLAFPSSSSKPLVIQRSTPRIPGVSMMHPPPGRRNNCRCVVV